MRRLIILFSLLFSTQVFSHPQFIFEEAFDLIYEEGRCGDNVRNFIKLLKKSKVNLSKSKVVEITNRGSSVFGLVNVEYARHSGPLVFDPAKHEKVRSPGERNWYHHVILIHNDEVYDFDFGNHPEIVSVGAYFNKMFFLEERSGYGVYFVGEEQKRKDYLLIIRSALDVVNSTENNTKLPEGDEMSLGDFLDQF